MSDFSNSQALGVIEAFQPTAGISSQSTRKIAGPIILLEEQTARGASPEKMEASLVRNQGLMRILHRMMSLSQKDISID